MGAISNNAAKFGLWLEEAPQGNFYEYHRGYLPTDRGDKTVDRLAAAAAHAYLDGSVILLQERRGPGDYIYLAQRR
jgi:hypothetical protein